MKKLRRKVSKMVKKCKAFLDDQMWYAKEFWDNLDTSYILNRATNLVIAPLLLAFSIVVLSLLSHNIHTAYLEKKVADQVVYMRSPEDAKQQGSGTGFHMKTPNGHVVLVTNSHICGLANDKGEILVQEKQHSGRLIKRRVWERFGKNDLCVVEPLPGYSGLEMSNDVEVSDNIWTFGYPLGEGLNISSGRVKDFKKIWLMADDVKTMAQCKGERYKQEKFMWFIFIVEVCMKSFDSIATDAPTYPGNSGSPMVNSFGNVVGVIFAANGASAWGYAVPLSDLKELMSAY